MAGHVLRHCLKETSDEGNNSYGPWLRADKVRATRRLGSRLNWVDDEERRITAREGPSNNRTNAMVRAEDEESVGDDQAGLVIRSDAVGDQMKSLMENEPGRHSPNEISFDAFSQPVHEIRQKPKPMCLLESEKAEDKEREVSKKGKKWKKLAREKPKAVPDQMIICSLEGEVGEKRRIPLDEAHLGKGKDRKQKGMEEERDHSETICSIRLTAEVAKQPRRSP